MVKLLLMVLPILAVFACQSASEGTPQVLAVYEKTGGILGFDQRLVVRADGQLVLEDRRTSETLTGAVLPSELDRLRALFASPEFGQTQRQYAIEGADLITYRIEASTPSRQHTVSTTDGAKPPQIVHDTIKELERLTMKLYELNPGRH